LLIIPIGAGYSGKSREKVLEIVALSAMWFSPELENIMFRQLKEFAMVA
jgi:hypothetical protein